MPRHLLLVSLGPVQDFIAQAKRTRDLWFGSKLLCDLSRAAAKAILAHAGSVLIFPAMNHDGSLPEGMANKILALVEGEPGQVAKDARAAAREHLSALWEKARRGRAALIDAASEAAAKEQIDTAVEFHSAWAPCPTNGDYAEARSKVEEALAGRKQLYDFAPWSRQRGGVHKSSLDGARETVLLPPGKHHDAQFARYRIGLREELDAIGLLKRTGDEPEQFVPVPTIGLAAWVKDATKRCPEALSTLVEACERAKLMRVSRDAAWVRAFPFDAQIFLPGRAALYFADLGATAEEGKRFERDYVEPVRKDRTQPHPYVACIAADGDKMGDAIHALAKQGPAAHQRLSTGLAKFATRAKSIVETKHSGVLVYAGGDDVLAFVTVPDALLCAKALSEAFDEAMREVLAGSGADAPTLSVGLGIGHVLSSLSDLLELGREAEKTAKREGRNRLAIVVEMHAGSRSVWSEAWTRDPVERLEKDITCLDAKTINHGKLHELLAMRRKAPTPESAMPDAVEWAGILAREASRILGRTGLGSEGATVKPSDVGLDLGGDYEAAHGALGRFIERASIAEVFRRAKKAAEGRKS